MCPDYGEDQLSLPAPRMLLRAPGAPRWARRPRPAPQTCLLSCCLAASSQPPPHSPTSPLKKIPQAGPAAGVGEPPRSLPAPARRASTPPSRRWAAVLAAGQPRGKGCREEVPARGREGGRGSPGLRARSRGAAARRAGGSQLRGGRGSSGGRGGSGRLGS